MKKHLMALVFSIFLLSVAYAGSIEVIGFPNHLALHDVPEVLEFTVKNNSSYTVPIEVVVALPSEYEITRGSDFVDAESTVDFSIKIMPKENLKGSFYKGLIIVKAGREEVKKNIDITFADVTAEAVEITLDYEEEEEKIVVNGEIDNKSVKERVITLKENNLPENWTVSFEDITVGAESRKDFSFEIKPGSDFEGEGIFTFEFDGVEVNETIDLNYHSTADNFGFAGFLVVGGMQAFGGLELVIDVVLAIVAALLLVAFISRLVKRYSNGRVHASMPAAETVQKVQEKPRVTAPKETHVKIEPKKTKAEKPRADLEELKNKIIENGGRL